MLVLLHDVCRLRALQVATITSTPRPAHVQQTHVCVAEWSVLTNLFNCSLTGENIGPFSFEILRGYFIYIMAFAGGIYANMQGLKKLSPETTTVIR